MPILRAALIHPTKSAPSRMGRVRTKPSVGAILPPSPRPEGATHGHDRRRCLGLVARTDRSATRDRVLAYANGAVNAAYLVAVKSHLREEAITQLQNLLHRFRTFSPRIGRNGSTASWPRWT